MSGASGTPREIDLLHAGFPHALCCFQIEEAIVDPGPESCVTALLAALGATVPTRILLTHIHLDHAGATGALVRRWPHVEVWVHERGARHLIEPTKLIASATSLYGVAMERLWGAIVPVPEANIRVLSGGEQIGPWRVAYTPGHAKHHVSYLHETTGTAFVGEVAGVRIGNGPILPPTPPPDIDVDAWHHSLDGVAGWRPTRLALGHFGAFDDVNRHLQRMHDALRDWSERASDGDAASYADALVRVVRDSVPSPLAAAYVDAMPPNIMWAGLDQYRIRRAAVSSS